MTSQPFYDPEKSYEENYSQGPFGAFADGQIFETTAPPAKRFLDFPVHEPFGIPAGPLLNGKFVKAALDKGFDLPIYKTVRTLEYPSHPWPNVLAVHPDSKLDATGDITLTADRNYSMPLSITNSFGVPSKPVPVWQQDLADAVKAARPGQVVIASFQGTKSDDGDVQSYINDFVRGAALIKETGVKIMEINLSCPNEGTAHMLCFDIERVATIMAAIRKEIGKTPPIILKIAYYSDNELLRQLITKTASYVQGYSAINTIPATIVDEKGEQALPGAGRLRSGVCGTSIKWAGLEMVRRLVEIRQDLKLNYAVIGVGGVMTSADYNEYRSEGADAVMSATGAMWNPHLAQEIKKAVHAK